TTCGVRWPHGRVRERAVAPGGRACARPAHAAREERVRNQRPVRGDLRATMRRMEAARRIGIMGGTFDPIHHGHLVAASEVAERFALDEVIFAPTGAPWQKSDREVSAAEDRYLMAVIATASNPRFWVSRVDIDRPGPTFTIDTIRDIAALREGAELFFITGADALSQILSWHNHDEMLRMARFIGVTRPGHEL